MSLNDCLIFPFPFFHGILFLFNVYFQHVLSFPEYEFHIYFVTFIPKWFFLMLL